MSQSTSNLLPVGDGELQFVPLNKQHLYVQPDGAKIQRHVVEGAENKIKQNKTKKNKQKQIHFIQ